MERKTYCMDKNHKIWDFEIKMGRTSQVRIPDLVVEHEMVLSIGQIELFDI